MLSLLLFLVCLCLFWVLLLGPNSPKGPPVLPGGWPFIGHIFEMSFKDAIQLWEKICKYTNLSLKQGGISQGNLGPIKVYFVTDPDACQTVSNVCLQKPYLYKFATLFANGLFIIDPPTWKSHRKLFTRAFNHEKLNTYMELFNEESKILCDKIDAKVGQGMFNPEPYLTHCLFIIACRTALEINSNECNQIYETYTNIVERSYGAYTKRLIRIWLHIPFIYNWSSLKKECDEYIKLTTTKLTGLIVKKRKLERKEFKKSKDKDDTLRNGEFSSILDLLIDVQEIEAITDAEIRERIDAMIVANYDTSSISLLILIIIIGSYPDVQDKIFNELKNALDDHKRDLNRQDISKLVYLEAVVKETFRLYPAIPIIGRKATEEVKLKDYTIPAGGFYMLSMYGMHRHAMWGTDAEQFSPERWLEPGGVPDNAFGAFSIGKRNCIAKTYAMMSVKTILAHLLLRYRITADVSKIKWKWNIFLKPESGHKISVELRT